MEKIEGKEMFEAIQSMGHYSGKYFEKLKSLWQGQFLDKYWRLFNLCMGTTVVIEI